jgi:hypothetical protein
MTHEDEAHGWRTGRVGPFACVSTVLTDIYFRTFVKSLWKVVNLSSLQGCGLCSWGPQAPLSLLGVRVGVGIRSGVQLGSWITEENSLVPWD